MKKLVTVFIVLFSIHLYAQEDQIKGFWLNEEGDGQVKIFKATDGKFYGKIEWGKDGTKKDVNNPDEKLRNQKVVGLLFLKAFAYDKNKKQWTGGTIYDPNNGKTYDCYMWFEGDLNKLIIKGYVMGMKFVGRQTIWTREKELRN